MMKEMYQGLGHIAINTRNMEESIAFYEKIGGSVLARDVLEKHEGTLKLALVDLGGVTLELLEHPVEMPLNTGNIPHFAVYVKDVDAAAAALSAAGVDSFKSPAKAVCPELFGGLENRFFTGPSGEEIELLHMY